jgi:hypothetical protein
MFKSLVVVYYCSTYYKAVRVEGALSTDKGCWDE